MARKRKTAKKARTKHNRRYELIGVIIICLGIFAVFSIYTSSAGIAGTYFKNILKGLFGIISFVMPLFIIIIGILFIMTYYKNVNKVKLGLSISTIILIFQLVHLLYIEDFDSSGLKIFIKESYNKGIEGQGAGVLVSPLVYIIIKWFGILGSYLILIMLSIIVLLLLTNLSLKQLGINAYERVNEKLPDIGTRNKKIEGFQNERGFEGETVSLNSDGNIGADPQYLKDAFNNIESTTTADNIDEHTDDLKIVDYISSYEKKAPKSIDKKEKSVSFEEVEHEIQSSKEIDSEKTIKYPYPPIELLEKPTGPKEGRLSSSTVKNRAKVLEKTLGSFGISAKVLQVSRGPAITRFELQPAPGIKVSRIVNLADDIALNMAASGIRIEAPIPGKAAIGVEVPNKDISSVYLREVLESREFQNYQSGIGFGLGKDIAGKPVIADISKMPHLLIAGATGSGKSVCINSIIVSIIYKYSPEDVKLILIDPKVVELNHFNGIPHLLIPVVTDPKKAAGALNWAIQEMVKRYKIFADKGVKDIKHYNMGKGNSAEEKLPQIIVIIDELSDLMMVAPGDVEDAICRLAQMARAAGIHLVIATQRPSVDVITGLIKANIPSRIAFAVSSNTDSRTILDMGGAEKLLGRGDMLFYPVGAPKPIRVQGCFVSEKDINAVVEHLKVSYESPQYNMDIVEEIASDKISHEDEEFDELLPEAIEIVIDAGQASISMLQRRLRVGYARAARMIDEMEVRGLVSGFDGSKPRNVLITREEFDELYKE